MTIVDQDVISFWVLLLFLSSSGILLGWELFLLLPYQVMELFYISGVIIHWLVAA
jgi:hypothetical protein